MKYHNKRVLALPFGEYFNIFEKIFIEGKRQWNWDIQVIATSCYLKPYKQFLDSEDQLRIVPDFLKKQDWESDPKQWEEVQKLMRASERTVQAPLSRILLSCERTVGRAYSKANYYWPETYVARCVQKRKDLADAILARAFKFSLEVIRDFKPDFCLGAPPSGIINAVFYFVARQLDIPFVASIFSSALPDRHFWTQEWGSFSSDINAVFQKKKQASCKPSEASLEHIKSFRKEPEPLPYYKENWSDKSNMLSFINTNRFIIETLIYRLVPIIKGEKISDPKLFFQSMINAYRTYFLKIFQRKRYASFSDKELSQFDYVYYPMHQDPEFVLNVRGTSWYDQLSTIKKLSFNLPAGCKLLVREHRNNIGRRSTAFLKEISRYPGVILVDAYDDQYKYIKNANLIITVNGSTGFEGILLKKNVMTLDRTSYDALNFSFKLKDTSELGSLLLTAFYTDQLQENYDRDIALFLDSERETYMKLDEDPEIEMNKIQEIMDRDKTEKCKHGAVPYELGDLVSEG